jgi:hypothetical protein
LTGISIGNIKTGSNSLALVGSASKSYLTTGNPQHLILSIQTNTIGICSPFFLTEGYIFDKRNIPHLNI